MAEKYNAVILAGGRVPWLKDMSGTDIRCLVKINGKCILDYLIETLQSSSRVKDIVVALPDEESLKNVTLPEGVMSCVADVNMPATAAKAAAVFGVEEKILFVCDDIPLLTTAAVNDFLDQCEQFKEKQVFYPVIPKDVCLQKYPDAKRTYGKLADGSFTGGNMMLIDCTVIPKGLAAAEEIFARRKNPLALCRWLGFGFILKLLLGLLDTKGAEKRTSELLDMPCKVIVSNFAEVGMDVDKPEDLRLIEKYLK